MIFIGDKGREFFGVAVGVNFPNSILQLRPPSCLPDRQARRGRVKVLAWACG